MMGSSGRVENPFDVLLQEELVDFLLVPTFNCCANLFLTSDKITSDVRSDHLQSTPPGDESAKGTKEELVSRL